MRLDLVPAARIFAVSTLLAALASCGGGGGGGGTSGPVPTVALTASNAQNVGGNVALASAQLARRGDLFAPLSVQDTSPPRQSYVLSRFLADQIDRIARIGQLRAPQLALSPADVSSVDCVGGDGGSITTSADANAISETFNACSNAPGQSTSGVITFSNFSATASSFSGSLSINLTFTASGVSETFAGSFGISATGLDTNVITITISGSNLVLQQGATIENLGNFSFSTTIDQTTLATTNSITFMYTSDEIGGTVAVTTLTPFDTAPGKTFPHTGALLITGVAGSAIKVTVNGDESGPTPQVKIEVDANGDGIFELPPLEVDWSAFN